LTRRSILIAHLGQSRRSAAESRCRQPSNIAPQFATAQCVVSFRCISSAKADRRLKEKMEDLVNITKPLPDSAKEYRRLDKPERARL
jgi:hypothetical protein